MFKADYKQRVATSVSTVLRRRTSRHARRTVSATNIHPFPGKNVKVKQNLTNLEAWGGQERPFKTFLSRDASGLFQSYLGPTQIWSGLC